MIKPKDATVLVALDEITNAPKLPATLGQTKAALKKTSKKLSERQKSSNELQKCQQVVDKSAANRKNTEVFTYWQEELDEETASLQVYKVNLENQLTRLKLSTWIARLRRTIMLFLAERVFSPGPGYLNSCSGLMFIPGSMIAFYSAIVHVAWLSFCGIFCGLAITWIGMFAAYKISLQHWVAQVKREQDIVSGEVLASDVHLTTSQIQASEQHATSQSQVTVQADREHATNHSQISGHVYPGADSRPGDQQSSQAGEHATSEQAKSIGMASEDDSDLSELTSHVPSKAHIQSSWKNDPVLKAQAKQLIVQWGVELTKAGFGEATKRYETDFIWKDKIPLGAIELAVRAFHKETGYKITIQEVSVSHTVTFQI